MTSLVWDGPGFETNTEDTAILHSSTSGHAHASSVRLNAAIAEAVHQGLTREGHGNDSRIHGKWHLDQALIDPAGYLPCIKECIIQIHNALVGNDSSRKPYTTRNQICHASDSADPLISAY